MCWSKTPVSTGHVEPGPGNNKWFNTWATVRGQTARVGTESGNFTVPNVPIYPGVNHLDVTVRDVSGNVATQTRSVQRPMEETFHYDGNGNLTNWVSGTTNWVYEWDWADRLSKVTSNGITVLENWYDAGNRRLAKKDAAYALYLWDGWESLAVLNQSGVAQEIFTRGIGLAGDIGTLVAVTKPSTPAIYYAHHNHRGDVTTVRYGTTTTATYGYSAYGNLVSWTGTDVCRFKFSSKERESSCGWSYYGFRFYVPQWQRWGSRDIIAGGNMGAATALSPWDDEVNVYMFVANDPILRKDAYGLQFGPGNGDGQCDVDKCKERCHKYADALARQGGFDSATALRNCFEGCDRDANYVPGSPLPPLPATKPSPKEPLLPLIKACVKIAWEWCKDEIGRKKDKK